MRLRNDSGYPLNAQDLGRQVAPGEEFEHVEYVTGCTNLDPPPDDSGGQPTEGDPSTASTKPATAKAKAAPKTGDPA